ncbi:MAG: ABC transporter permease [Alistipes sp.]|jgi:putative ABC transport system permease protein|nr:ABC transporter permease [Alistipes sp.]
MKFFDTDSFQEIWATITRNKFRSIATGFGVFWGLFMLIVLIAVGNKLKQGMMSQVQGVSENSVLFMTQRTTEAYKGYRKGRYWSLDVRDIDLIRERSNTVKDISPMLFGGGGDRNTVRGMKSGTYQFSGVYPTYFDMMPTRVDSGRRFNEMDVAERRKVCVIGEAVYETLFDPGENPLGEFIRMDGIYFQVVGVIGGGNGGIQIGGPIEEQIFLPFTTAQMMFRRDDGFEILMCTTRDGVAASELETEIRALVGNAHGISPTDNGALMTLNLEEMFKMFRGLFTGINILMWIVGLGALFSGIIGISNIMLVTVRERMREIGVRRALGAKPTDIIVQIMSESFVLTAIAGMMGFLLGVATSLGVEKMSMGGDGGPPVTLISEPLVSFDLALAAMAVLVASGVVAGLLPAMKALTIKAIDAIRDE